MSHTQHFAPLIAGSQGRHASASVGAYAAAVRVLNGVTDVVVGAGSTRTCHSAPRPTGQRKLGRRLERRLRIAAVMQRCRWFELSLMAGIPRG
jgi:hypothetical protein